MVFDKSSYRDVLVEFLGASGTRSGQRSALSKALGCQTAYISQILKGDANLNMEQALGFAQFADFDKASTDFFLLLVQKDRAGTAELKKYYQNKIDLALNERNQIKSRLEATKEISEADKVKYYSSWLYSACHVALTIKELNSIAALSERFKIPKENIMQIVEALMLMGLARQDDEGKFAMGSTNIHLSEDSDHILKHHTNWRIRALKSLEFKSPKDLHYSVVYSLSFEDALKLRENLIQVIKENLEIVKPSLEETLYCQNIDFFEI